MRVLVPLDFSDNSLQALRYALKLFNRAEDEVIACHFFNDQTLERSGLSAERDPVEFFSKKIVAEMNGELKESKVAFTSTARFGDFPEDVIDLRRKVKPDLFVLGTKGASGLKEVFMGSNTSKLIESSKKPVLVIPDGCAFQPIESILFCSDLQILPEINTLSILKTIAKLHGADIRLANVKKSRRTRSTYDQTLEREREITYLEDEKIEVTYKRIFSSDVINGIDYYVRKKGDVNMLAVISRKHGLMDKVFNNSISRKLAHRTQLPLLVLKELH